MAFLHKTLPQLLNYYLNKELNGLEEPRMSGTCRITSVSSRVSYCRIVSQGLPPASPHNPCPLRLLYSAIIIQLLLLLSCTNDLRPRIVCHINVCFLCPFSFFSSIFDCSPALASAFYSFLL